MKKSQLIEKNLSSHEGFSLSQTFGHPFKDFTISHVGETFEELINTGLDTVLPVFDLLFKTFMEGYSSQFESQPVTEKDVTGRVARMWASLVREWHAYFVIREEFEERKIRANVERTDILDTMNGIDVYIENPDNPDRSLKVDILMESQKALLFREKKDRFRQKGGSIPGEVCRIHLGKENPGSTKFLKDINGHEWFLISDVAVDDLIKNYRKS